MKLYENLKLNIQRFATTVGTATKTVATVGGVSSACKFEATCVINSQDKTNRKSNVTITFKATSLKTSCGYGSLGSPTATITQDGTQRSSKSITDFKANTTITLGSWTGDIQHSSDGTKKINITCVYDPAKSTGYYVYAPVKTTLTFSATLTTIAVKSTLNSASIKINTNGVITITPNITINNSSYYNILHIRDANKKELFTINGVTHNKEYTLTNAQALQLYSYIGNNTNYTFQVYVKTKTSSSGDDLGNSAAINSTATLPNYSIYINNASIYDKVTAYDQYKSVSSKQFIMNISSPVVTFTAGSTTSNTYGNPFVCSPSNSPYDIGILTSSYLPVIKATDGRKSATWNPADEGYSVIPYTLPEITSFSFNRTAPTEGTAVVEFHFRCYNGGGLKDTLSIDNLIEYNENGGTTKYIGKASMSVLENYNDGDTLVRGHRVTISGLDPNKTIYYNIHLYDRIGYHIYVSGTVMRGTPVFNAFVDSNGSNNFRVNGNFMTNGNRFAVYDNGDMWNAGSIVTNGNLNCTNTNTTTVNATNINATQGVNSHLNQTGIAGTGTSGGKFSFYQTSSVFYGSANDWASYLISNHGNGDNYYHQMIRMPFWGVPQYQRMEGGALKGWKTFITTENTGLYTGGGMSSTTNLPSGTYTTVQRWSVPETGTYIITALFRWDANTSGYRRCNIVQSEVSDVHTAAAPCPSGLTHACVTRIMGLSAGATIYFRMQQNSGSTIGGHCMFEIYKLR